MKEEQICLFDCSLSKQVNKDEEIEIVLSHKKKTQSV